MARSNNEKQRDLEQTNLLDSILRELKELNRKLGFNAGGPKVGNK